DLQRTLDEELPKHGMSAVVKLFGPPPVSGLGSSGGFKFIVEDRSGVNDLVRLQQQTEEFIAASRPRRAELPEPAPGVKSNGKKDGVELASDKHAPSDGALDIAVSPRGPQEVRVEVAVAKPSQGDQEGLMPQEKQGPKGSKETKGEPKV